MPHSTCFIKHYAFLRQFDVNSNSIVVCGIESGEKKTQIVIYCNQRKTLEDSML